MNTISFISPGSRIRFLPSSFYFFVYLFLRGESVDSSADAKHRNSDPLSYLEVSAKSHSIQNEARKKA